jgi:hypothetical protein
MLFCPFARRRLIHLLDPAPPLIHRQHLPIDLDPFCLEDSLDLRGDGIKVFSGKGKDGRSRAGEADAEETGVGLVCQGREDFGEAGDLRISERLGLKIEGRNCN